MSAREKALADVLAIGPLPPPIHGYSLVTAGIIELLRRITRVEVLDMSSGTLARGWRYHATRGSRAASAAWQLARRPARGRTLYLAIAGGAGVLYDLAFVLAARWRGYRIVIHHHAFSYINRWSVWTAALVATAGCEALHICLCRAMAHRLGQQYPIAERRVVLSNAALVPPSSATQRPSTRTAIRLGFLSNLIAEKGLDTAIAVATTLRELGGAVSLVVAGPAPDRTAERLLENAKARLGGALEYRGAVHGERKATFFEDIDAFLFPTRYPNEAQPLVVLEALAHGIPVIASARGCIAEDIGDSGVAVPSEGDFVASAVDAISCWLADRSRLRSLSARAQEQAVARHRAAASGLERVIEMIAGTAIDDQSPDPRVDDSRRGTHESDTQIRV